MGCKGYHRNVVMASKWFMNVLEWGKVSLSVDRRLPVQMTDYTCFSSLFINGAFMWSRNNRNVPSGDDLLTARAHVVCSWNVGRKNRTAMYLMYCFQFSIC